MKKKKFILAGVLVVLLVSIVVFVTKEDIKKDGIPVICYHSIQKEPATKSPIVISDKLFESHLKTIKDLGYKTLTLSQFGEYINTDKPLPNDVVLLTFDDGYENNYSIAYPLLKKYGMNATMFLILDKLDKETYMSKEAAIELSKGGIDIQSHTYTHRELGTLSYEDQLKELANSKSDLEKLTGKTITSIAYPVGSFNDDTKKAATETGYKYGFTINRGYVKGSDSKLELNRICVDYTYSKRDLKKILE